MTLIFTTMCFSHTHNTVIWIMTLCVCVGEGFMMICRIIMLSS